MYAIIENGGKQYKVAVGDKIKVEKLGLLEGTYRFDKVLAVKKEDVLLVGTPQLENAVVVAEVLCEKKDKKIIVYKFKAKKGFHKKKGHRQPYTHLKITSIEA